MAEKYGSGIRIRLFSRIRIRSRKNMDPDLLVPRGWIRIYGPERLDPDPVNIRPNPKPWVRVNKQLKALI